MLIVNDDQLCLAGIFNLEERCSYCSKAFEAYPLIMGDDVEQTVYHVACALQLVTDIMVDLYTFFSPPAPSHQLYALTASQAFSPQNATGEKRAMEGVSHALVDRYPPD